jgi:D-alanyl-D-alanine carboxypeptidase
MKRKTVLLSVVALMAVMLATSVAPAFAAAPNYICFNESTGQVFYNNRPFEVHTLRQAGFTCEKEGRRI